MVNLKEKESAMLFYCTQLGLSDFFVVDRTEDGTLPKVRHDFRSPNPNCWGTLKNIDQNNICASIVFKLKQRKNMKKYFFLRFLFQNS